MFFIEALVYDFDEASQLIEDEKTGAWIELTGCSEGYISERR